MSTKIPKATRAEVIRRVDLIYTASMAATRHLIVAPTDLKAAKESLVVIRQIARALITLLDQGKDISHGSC